MRNFYRKKWIIFSLFLVASLVCIQILFIKNKPWVADYWEHKAVFLELCRNTSIPTHPIVNTQKPHAFFSPYYTAAAALSKLTKIKPSSFFDGLTIVNLFLFLTAIWLLGKLVIKDKNNWRSFSLLLLALLFVWGVFPPYFSSFFHFVSLPYTIVYPSVFAFCLSVFSAFFFNYTNETTTSKGERFFSFFVSVFLNWVVLLTHPLTFVFCFSLFLYLGIRKKIDTESSNEFTRKLPLQIVYFTLFFLVPLLFAGTWTYYPFWQLVFNVNEQHRFHTDSVLLYKGIILSYYTLIIPFCLLIYGLVLKQKSAQVVSVVIFILLILYSVGGLTAKYGYGRSVSYIVIWLQMWLLLFLKEKRQFRLVVCSFVIAASIPFIYISAKSIWHAATTTHNDYLKSRAESRSIASMPTEVITHSLFFLDNHIKDGALIMADLVSSRYIAALGGKTIATPYADYWISDNEIRMADVMCFFNEADSATRVRLLLKYKPQYLLLNPDIKQDVQKSLPQWLVESEIVGENGYVLISLGH